MKFPILIFAIVCGIRAAPTEEDALQEFIIGNRKFTAAIYKELIKVNEGNLIVSPFSAETILALTHEGAKGESASELATGLFLPKTKERTRAAMKSFLPKLKKSDDDLKLLSANKIYVANDAKLEDDFRATAENVYDSGLENIDFVQNVKAADTMNEWVESRTNNKIKELINSDDIDGDTKLVLINALYFSGKWQNQFEDYLTSKKKFYKSKDESVDVDMMHQTEYLKYYENPKLNAKFLELPYQGSNISMIIALPNEKEGLAELEQNIEELLEPQPLKFERVDVQLPRFTIESEIKFIPILKKLGINKVFGREADLSGLSSTHKDLVISDVVQKAFINVTESGTEAAAATAVLFAEAAAIIYDHQPPKVFYVQHPFFYCIVKDGVILFAGRVAN
ncbi:antichymotrypsin-2 isoform X5 [Leptinotarsa decemlineata]|uniref:antichymotrypsin-2 isoform X5 n=1 Tax=Leptinotarsa decemlineata TaxID=7539 RepID=UPI000C252941|nr:antichymotrypsin-2-like isoform X5 [Leptinotarsa decemlineata]